MDDPVLLIQRLRAKKDRAERAFFRLVKKLGKAVCGGKILLPGKPRSADIASCGKENLRGGFVSDFAVAFYDSAVGGIDAVASDVKYIVQGGV